MLTINPICPTEALLLLWCPLSQSSRSMMDRRNGEFFTMNTGSNTSTDSAAVSSTLLVREVFCETCAFPSSGVMLHGLIHNKAKKIGRNEGLHVPAIRNENRQHQCQQAPAG